MRKKSLRFISAALAVSMMASTLPVGAFALEVGAADPAAAVSEQENQGERLEGSERITDDKIGAEACGVYRLEGNYGAKTIEINTKKDVTLNITGPVEYDSTQSQAFIIVNDVGTLTINGNNNTVTLSQSNRVVDFKSTRPETKMIVNGGSYVDGGGFHIYRGSAELNDVTVHAVYYDNAVWAKNTSKVVIDGGEYTATSGDAIYVDGKASVELSRANVKSRTHYAISNGGTSGNKSSVTINSGSYTSERNSAVYNDNSGTVEIYDGQFEGDTDKSPYVGYGTALINNNRNATAKIHGGYFVQKSGSHAGYKASLLNVGTMIIDGSSVNVESEDCAAVENTLAGVLEIENGTFKSSGSNCIIVGNGSSATLTGGTIEAPNGSAVKTKGTVTIDGTTLQNSGYGIYVEGANNYSAHGATTIKSVALSGNSTDIYLGVDSIYNGPVSPTKKKDDLVTIEESFTGEATVECENPSEGRRITTATTSNYQQELNLISADPLYTVAYEKDEDGSEYRYLAKRTSFVVIAQKAVAKADLGDNEEKLDETKQVAPNTVVSVTADEIPNKLFRGWTIKVGKTAVDPDEFLVYSDENDKSKATFSMPEGDVTIIAEYEDVIVDPGTSDGTSDGDYGGDIAAGVVIGGIAVVGAYEVGTGLYRILAMDDVAMPANRIALAKLLWERAGKPEPETMTDENLYSDMDAEDEDAQKAARWAVEQELLNDDDSVEGELKFHPAFPVSKLRVCLTWENAKQKGLFDKTEA